MARLSVFRVALAAAFRAFFLLLLLFSFLAAGQNANAFQQFSEPFVREIAVTSASIADYALHSDESNTRFVLNAFEKTLENRLFKQQYDAKTLENIFSKEKTRLTGAPLVSLENYLKQKQKKSLIY